MTARIVALACAGMIMSLCGVASAQQTTLRLDQAREIATEQNIAVLIAALDRSVNELSRDIAYRPYVPLIGFDTSWRDQTSLVVQGERNRSLAYSASASMRTRHGTSASASLGSTEFFSGASFVPQPTTAVRFDVAQSLLRDGWRSSTLLDQRELDYRAQRVIFLDQLNALLLQVDQAYWELVYAQADLEIKTRSRDRAQEQFEHTTENIKRGLLANSEIYIVEENLVFFEQQLVRSHESLELARVRLARLLRLPVGAELVATASPSQVKLLDVSDRGAFVDGALASNPTLMLQELSIESAQVQLDFDENQTDPRLDLSAGVTLNGIDEQRAAAWGQALTAKNPDLRVQLSFEAPLVWKPDRARIERSEVALEREKLVKENLQDTVKYGLTELLVQLERRRQVLELAGRRVELAELKLDTEVDKYRSAISTLANVVLFQRDLDSARIAHQRALIDVIVMETRIYNLQGTLYERAGIRVD